MEDGRESEPWEPCEAWELVKPSCSCESSGGTGLAAGVSDEAEEAEEVEAVEGAVDVAVDVVDNNDGARAGKGWLVCLAMLSLAAITFSTTARAGTDLNAAADSATLARGCLAGGAIESGGEEGWDGDGDGDNAVAMVVVVIIVVEVVVVVVAGVVGGGDDVIVVPELGNVGKLCMAAEGGAEACIACSRLRNGTSTTSCASSSNADATFRVNPVSFCSITPLLSALLLLLLVLVLAASRLGRPCRFSRFFFSADSGYK